MPEQPRVSARELGRAHAWCTLLVLTNACAQLWHEFGLWLPCGVAAVPRCSLAWVASQRVRVLLRRLCVGAPGAERAAPGSPEPLGQRSSLELLLLLIIPPSCIFSNFPPQGFQSNFTICRSGSCFAHFQRREAAAVALGALGPPAPLPGLLCPGAAWGGLGPRGPRRRREVLGRERCAATGVQEDALLAQFVYWQAASSKTLLSPNTPLWE